MSILKWLFSPIGTGASTGAKEIAMSVTERGFEPATIRLRKDEPVVLAITRRTDRTCAKEIVAEELGVRAELPLQATVRIALTPKSAGRIRFGCGMGKMISGIFEIA